MKPLFPALLFCLLAAPVHAESNVLDQLLASTRALGEVNGVALACNYDKLVAKARATVLQRAPKTRRFGEAYEEASTAAFNAQTTGGTACPEEVVLALKLEMADQRMQELGQDGAGR
jgi:hypothetical protein